MSLQIYSYKGKASGFPFSSSPGSNSFGVNSEYCGSH